MRWAPLVRGEARWEGGSLSIPAPPVSSLTIALGETLGEIGATSMVLGCGQRPACSERALRGGDGCSCDLAGLWAGPSHPGTALGRRGAIEAHGEQGAVPWLGLCVPWVLPLFCMMLSLKLWGVRPLLGTKGQLLWRGPPELCVCVCV